MLKDVFNNEIELQNYLIKDLYILNALRFYNNENKESENKNVKFSSFNR